MKRSLLLLVVAASTALAAPQTIKTRSGQTFTSAEITKTDGVNATVSHSDGITSVPLEDLPADLQRQIGYTTKAERAAIQADADAKATVAQAKDNEAKAMLAEVETARDAEKKAALAAIKGASPVKAGSFYGKTEAQLVEMFGAPIKTINDKSPDDGSFKILVYENDKAKGTLFSIYASDGFVGGGLFKGVAIQNPKRITDDTKLEALKRLTK